ncbi:MAG: hypothetical protein IH867_08870 [Chloroflexi bacterium]|nr:hypothetical protein [Chloroflexota bacterium]
MSEDTFTNRDFMAYLRIFAGESDRGVAVVGAAMIETALLDSISKHSKLGDLGFIKSSSTGQKADLASKLDLLNEEWPSMIRKLIDIRNDAAHIRSELAVDLESPLYLDRITPLGELIATASSRFAEGRPFAPPGPSGREILIWCYSMVIGHIDAVSNNLVIQAIRSG